MRSVGVYNVCTADYSDNWFGTVEYRHVFIKKGKAAIILRGHISFGRDMSNFDAGFLKKMSAEFFSCGAEMACGR